MCARTLQFHRTDPISGSRTSESPASDRFVSAALCVSTQARHMEVMVAVAERERDQVTEELAHPKSIPPRRRSAAIARSFPPTQTSVDIAPERKCACRTQPRTVRPEVDRPAPHLVGNAV
eukprot:3941747-Rhodomonas_salina.4